ncbi:MAG: hypothetical protein U5L09_05110 [Bacteroidales bacterium]|nr:hypothetical protein [Bacteroidales bacterium]
MSKNQTVAEVKRYVLEKLAETNIKTEYSEIVDSHTLQPDKELERIGTSAGMYCSIFRKCTIN